MKRFTFNPAVSFGVVTTFTPSSFDTSPVALWISPLICGMYPSIIGFKISGESKNIA